MANDPAAQSSPAQQSDGASRRQIGDVLATVVLVIVHFGLYGATFVVLGLLVMGTDSCGYQKCGDPAWLDRAMHLGAWAGGVLLLADVALTLFRVVRKRVAWVVPLIGCIAQVALAFGAGAMESLAGPV
ncbi:hypothetical protein GCM10009641_00950 [Mycobacterium cookii]|uniref:Uncharacterized protein n=1 Tax=Mycobacterium cookii TaxID=1775 RepID=A0A7I7L4E0_9MYCO|nr:DUF6264 family protein [Mycobacterium cookii]MCV7329308.1 hypothetical protein [Mycobacterium cookii]BBX48859.1 hypothetical protein MCOO_48740 [Mycobacterium cookii]